MSLEDRVAALEARVQKLEHEPIKPIGPPESSFANDVIWNSDGSFSSEDVREFKALLEGGDRMERDFARYIPDKFIVFSPANYDSLDAAGKAYIDLNSDRARMTLLTLRGQGDGKRAYAFSWIVHKVKPVGFFRTSYEFDFDAGQVMDTLAYPPGVDADSVLDRIKASLTLWKLDFIDDPNDFSPKPKE